VEQPLGQADGSLFREIWILREQTNGIDKEELPFLLKHNEYIDDVTVYGPCIL
jgi:hypothetical protein